MSCRRSFVNVMDFRDQKGGIVKSMAEFSNFKTPSVNLE